MTVPADDAVAARLAPFADDPARSVVIVDFDGTLAPIVADPPAAAPLPGATDVLARLVAAGTRVAVVSGRPVAFLRRALPVAGLGLFGQYGVERLDGGVVWTLPEARAWGDASGRRPPRRRPLSRACSWNARDPSPWRSTGAAVADLAAGARAALFIGDDRGDVAAFDALGRLVDEGRLGHALRVAVRSVETPPDLLARADLAVEGPAGAVGLLDALADRLDRARRRG